MNKQHKLMAVIALALAAGNASASVGLTETFDPSDPTNQATPVLSNNGAGSSVLLAVNDQTSGSSNYGKTFLLDLSGNAPGLNYGSFVNGTQGTNGTLSWNLSSYTQFVFGSDTKLSWAVVAGSVADSNAGSNLGNGSGIPQTTVAPWGIVETQQNPSIWTTGSQAGSAALVTATQTQGDVGGSIQAANNSLSLLHATSNVVTAPGSGSGAFAYSALLPNEGTIGAGTVGLYAITNATGLVGGADTNVEAKLGTFSFTTGAVTGGSDVLTYTAVAPTTVPVPAGVWLFISGLVTMLGFRPRGHQSTVSV